MRVAFRRHQPAVPEGQAARFRVPRFRGSAVWLAAMPWLNGLRLPRPSCSRELPLALRPATVRVFLQHAERLDIGENYPPRARALLHNPSPVRTGFVRRIDLPSNQRVVDAK